jgi:hypothetical protein
MRPSKTVIIAVTLVFMLLGMPSLVAKESGKTRMIQKPDAGEAYDPGPLEGDPWQDDDDGGLNFTSGEFTHIVIGPSMSLPFFSFHVVSVKLTQPNERLPGKTTISQNQVMKKTK